ncbi:MAG: glutamine-hydrolyzing GMP synthase [Polyangiaceae bacterium]
MARAPVLVVDFGSQYTQLIARRIREAHVYCEIVPCTLPFEELRALEPQALVLSGGPSSVYDTGAPTLDARVLELGVPILGICYGLQIIAHVGGGHVARSEHREYGPARVTVGSSSGILATFDTNESFEVWMSHGDRIEALPPGFEVLGTSANTPYCAVAHRERRIYGLQFHPEVAHTPRGREILDAFLFRIAKLSPDWTAASFIEQSISAIRARVGSSRAVLGLSGGVDSSVAAILCAKALGDRLTCIFIDNGLLRKDEARKVVETFQGRFQLNLVHVDAAEKFLTALAGVTDPEQKRKAIGRVFIEVFEEQARSIDESSRAAGAPPTEFLVQGTLYPDVIESVSFKGPSVTIKSHHNVGGLPERMNLKLCEPLRELFKDEVRAVGEALAMPHDVLYRHPFPGPGLAVRCLGSITAERLRVLREADAIFDEEIRLAGLYEQIWQAFCVLLPVRTVGVMGDDRTYDEVLALRAVNSTDGMTADWFRMPHEVLARASARITNEVRGINRVVYDVSSKPPATIEWE